MTFRSIAIKVAAPVLFAVCWSGSATAEPSVGGGPTLLVYGNYCGMGNNAPALPVDALDAACSRHDECTPDHDLPTKACNLRLEREAQAIALDPRQPGDVRMMASLVASFASSNASKAEPEVVPVKMRPTKARTVYTVLR